MKSSLYICPVCGFNGLKEPPYDKDGSPSYEICPCCGFEFGFEEKGDMAKFRENWDLQKQKLRGTPGDVPGWEKPID